MPTTTNNGRGKGKSKAAKQLSIVQEVSLSSLAETTVSVLNQHHGADYSLFHGDSCEVLQGIPENSIHLTVTSLPFSNIYSYTSSIRDLGNSHSHRQFFQQHGYITEQIKRITIPGRLVAIHCKEMPKYETRDGEKGRWDFPGAIVRHFMRHGFLYHDRITIQKDPQRPAREYHPQRLLYVTLRKDSTDNGTTEADYVLLFKKRGKNPIPVIPDVTDEEWVKFAHPVWTDIDETDILEPAEGMTNEDDRHLCAIQREVARRLTRMYSNPGEVVVDPFNGIATVGTIALERKRLYIGVELNPVYFQSSIYHMKKAENAANTDMWTVAGLDVEAGRKLTIKDYENELKAAKAEVAKAG